MHMAWRGRGVFLNKIEPFMPTMQIAVEGCCHGELDKIYECIQNIEKKDGRKIDLLICCGDFQAIRNKDDLECMACPPKYRHLGTFWKYYSGEKIAPYLTLFSTLYGYYPSNEYEMNDMCLYCGYAWISWVKNVFRVIIQFNQQ